MALHDRLNLGLGGLAQLFQARIQGIELVEVTMAAEGVPLAAALRDLLSAQPDDFTQARRIIALSRTEHQPMLEHRRF
jgi:hypothetical protein